MALSALPALRTSRLALRPVVESDLGLLIELNSDRDVMAYILGRVATPAETEAEWDQRLERRSDAARGLGYWLGFEDERFIGWWSASYYAPRPEISGIGYRLTKAGWGRGLATEGARAMVGQAFADPGIERVFAGAKVENTESRRVLLRLGMTRIDGLEFGEVGYELTRNDWEDRPRKTLEKLSPDA